MTTEQKIWQRIQRLVQVRPDGVPGRVTAEAIAQALGLKLEEDVPANEQWPLDREADLRAFYGAPGTGHVSIPVPYTIYYEGKPLNKITVHERIAQSVMNALGNVYRHYGDKQIAKLKLNVFDGCFNNRPKRGGSSLSVHAFAAALDFGAEWNGLHVDHTKALFAKPEYEAWWRAWEAEGAVSLGRERDFDYMHIQFARLP